MMQYDNPLYAAIINPGNVDNVITAFIALLLVSFVLAIPGTILGLQEKLFVYNGKADLVLSFIIPIVVCLTLIDFGFNDWVTWTLLGLSVVLIAISVRMTWLVSASFWKTILVFPTKFFLAGLITVCAFFAVGGMLAGLESAKKKKYGDAAKQLAVGVAAGAGYFKLKVLIYKLVKEPTNPKV